MIRSRMFRGFVLAAAVAFHATAADRSVFVLRTGPSSEQGIVRFDPEAGTESRFGDFLFRLGFGPYGEFSLTAVADRIIAQGVDYYEFDAGSGQLLRRYPALAAPYDHNWGFHGVAVDPPMAARLGIPAGYYGVPACPEGPSGPSACGGTVPFPGYAAWRNYAEQHVLLRRGFDPADSSLTLVKLFSPDAAGGSWNAERMTAIDPERRQFSFWLQGTIAGTSNGLLRLSTAPIVDGTIGDETFVHEEIGPPSNLNRRRSATAFTFDAATDSFLLADDWGAEFQQRITRRSAGGTEQVLTTVRDGYRIHAMTSLSPIEPELYTQLLPAVGDAPGANATYWRSDAWLFNPSDAEMAVALHRVSRPDLVMRLTLAPRQSTKIENVLRALSGGPAGDGVPTDAVLVESSYRAGAQLSVYSRTWTPAPSGGSYGQAVPAVPSAVGYSNHGTRSFAVSDTPSVFVLDKRDPGQFRHNVGVVNTSNEAITVRLLYAVAASDPADPNLERVLIVPPHSMRQYGIESLFPANVVETRPPMISVTASQPAAMWLSMVDNRTGDASFIPFTHYGLEVAPSSRLSLPAVAYAPGANGTFWRTDMYGIFANAALGAPVQSPETTFRPATGDCTGTTPQFRLSPTPGAPNISHWGPYWFHTFADVARQACGGSSSVSGALDVRTGSWMSAVSRTYTTRADGGTYGEILPLYPPLGWPARHFSGIEVNERSRVNSGFYNGSDAATRLELRLYAAAGELIASTFIDLAPRQSLQLPVGQLFGIEIPQGLYGLSVLPLDGAGTWPYVSTVDNVTGDPTNWW